MKFVNLVGITQSSASAELFTGTAFSGNTAKFGRGEYSAGKTEDSKFKSLKLSGLSEVAFYEKVDGAGKSATFRNDTSDLKLDFVPALIVVSGHAEALKGGKVVDALSEGEYTRAEIKKFDKIKVPKGLYLALLGNSKDANAIHLFENEEYTVDGRLDQYKRVALFSLGAHDVRLNFKVSDELSDDDLMAVAGGACKVDGCGAKACGADSPCAQACAGHA
ncbi:MAG: hypothetical protein LBT31_06040 [Synergistaceae bacterium]|jgi:hypothetical protein|nr:hypothetical protein [Synergistaceae bacterium]